MNHLQLGIYGESLAANFLITKKYKILAKNVRFKNIEIDIVAHDANDLVVVEVKTRQSALIGDPWKAVTRVKQKNLIAAINQYVHLHQIDNNIRFDIISIVHNQFQTKIEHIVDAFKP